MCIRHDLDVYTTPAGDSLKKVKKEGYYKIIINMNDTTYAVVKHFMNVDMSSPFQISDLNHIVTPNWS
jgi:hypothetical protein